MVAAVHLFTETSPNLKVVGKNGSGCTRLDEPCQSVSIAMILSITFMKSFMCSELRAVFIGAVKLDWAVYYNTNSSYFSIRTPSFMKPIYFSRGVSL